MSLRQKIKLIKIWRKDLSWKILLQCFFFQKILRINSHVPWPCHFTSIIHDPNKIKQGNRRPYIGLSPGSYFQTKNRIEMGDNTRIGPGVKIITGNHDPYDFDVHVKSGPIKIGKNCWLGADVKILPGVELGEHVIVGAGAVVTKSFGPDQVIAGVPAKTVKKIGKYGEKKERSPGRSTFGLND